MSSEGVDSSGGIAKDAGGVSGSAYVDTPVSGEEKPGVMQSTVETVRNLLGGLGLGAGSAAEGSSASEGTKQEEPRNAEDTSSSTTGAVTGGAAAAASGAAAAVGLSSNDKSDNSASAAPSTTAESTDKDVSMADTPQTSSSTTAKPEVDDSMPSGEQQPPSTVPDAATDDSVPSSGQPDTKPETVDGTPSENNKPVNEHSGGDSSKPGPGSSRENNDAIPTAGGEKLGQKHWGESDIVPDLPKKRESEAGQVSSSEGQPDDKTRDNTSANTGGAAPPSSSSEGDKGGEEKTKTIDKIKQKLHMEKK